jgi:hypothetical protein
LDALILNNPAPFGLPPMKVDMATSHALQYHADFAPTEAEFRAAIRAQIRDLMGQAHMANSDIDLALKNV